MLTDRFKALKHAIAQLLPDLQDMLAATLENALRRATESSPSVAMDVRAAIDRVLAQHAASLPRLQVICR